MLPSARLTSSALPFDYYHDQDDGDYDEAAN
jgi:hypothetical protein